MIPPVHALGQVALHTLLIYAFLMAMLRLVARRQLGQLTSIDLVIIIALGSAVETSMIAGNTSLVAGLVSAGTLLVINWVVSRFVLRWRRLRRLLIGSPVLLVHEGRFIDAHLRQIGFTEADVLEALRERECGSIDELRYAVLEPDGSIHCIRLDAPVHRPGDEDSSGESGAEPPVEKRAKEPRRPRKRTS